MRLVHRKRVIDEDGLHFIASKIARRRHGMRYSVSIEDVIVKLKRCKEPNRSVYKEVVLGLALDQQCQISDNIIPLRQTFQCRTPRRVGATDYCGLPNHIHTNNL